MQRVRLLKTNIVVVISYFLAGCIASIAPDVKPRAATFDHPDEVRRGKGFMVLADRRIFATMAFLNAVGYDEE